MTKFGFWNVGAVAFEFTFTTRRTRVQYPQPLISQLLSLLSQELELKVYHVGA